MTRIGKSSKSKSMALKAKSNDTDESLDEKVWQAVEIGWIKPIEAPAD